MRYIYLLDEGVKKVYIEILIHVILGLGKRLGVGGILLKGCRRSCIFVFFSVITQYKKGGGWGAFLFICDVNKKSSTFRRGGGENLFFLLFFSLRGEGGEKEKKISLSLSLGVGGKKHSGEKKYLPLSGVVFFLGGGGAAPPLVGDKKKRGGGGPPPPHRRVWVGCFFFFPPRGGRGGAPPRGGFFF